MTRASHSSQARRTRRVGVVLQVRPLILALCSAGCFSSVLAQAPAPTTMPNPVSTQQGIAPVAGTGSFNTLGSTASNPVQNYSQTSNVAVWHFNSFSIGAAGTVNNTARSASDLTVFRVIGSDRSDLAGALNANNRLILINRNGIHAYRGATFGGGGSLLASTHELDPTLSADNYAALLEDPSYIKFTSNAGQFVPNGSYGGYGGYGSYGDATLDIEQGVTMVAGDGGSIFLVGDRVRNQGTLQANGKGSVGLVAAGTVEMQMDVGDSGFIKLVSYDKLPSENVESSVARVAVNAGEISAQGGQVILAQANQFERGNSGDITPAPDVVASRFGSEYSPNGVYNTGTIEAKGANAQQGSVTLEAKGRGGVAVNAGTIDVSATDAASGAGSIRMSATNVLVGGNGESIARLVADGPSGGGNVTLDTLAAPQGVEGGSRIYLRDDSLISANATDATRAGDGGRVTLTTAVQGAERVAGLDQFGVIEAHGEIQALGAGGGKGGTLTTIAPVISMRNGDAEARINLGAGGLWRLVSNNVTIGSNFFSGEGGPSFTNIYADDISRALGAGTDVSMQAQHSGAQGSSFEEGFLTILQDTTIDRGESNGAANLTLESTNDLFVGGGTEITAGSGQLNVTLNADLDKRWLDRDFQPDGRGSLIIGETVMIPQLDRAQLLSSREVPQNVAIGANAVLIDSNGGNVVLTGAGRPPVNESDAGATSNAGVAITNTEIDAGQGSVTINGFGGSTPSEGGTSQNGVSIANAEITGASVSITGGSTSATGVAITNTEVEARSGPLTVIGASEGGNSAGQHIGVDIQDDVIFTTGAGGAKVHGLAVGGAEPAVGLRIKSLKVVTTAVPTAGVAAPLITLVGQSMQSSGPGLQVLSGGQGLIVEGPTPPDNPEGAPLSSIADIVIGANADGAAQALALGDVAPRLNTTGRVNIRPMSMEINNPAQATPDNAKAIHIGSATGSGTNFNIDSRWFGLPAASGAIPPARYVIGSNTHTGRITASAGALSGAGIVSLQNQGAGSQGISLGAQLGLRQLNLLSTGPIRQSGAWEVGVLNIITGESADVQLNAQGNRFGELNFDGAESLPNVTPGASPSSGDDDIAGFDTGTPEFQRLTISAVTTGGNDGDTPTDDDRDVDRDFEGTDLMNELRTDVYVHGQLSRPQLCTPANTPNGSPALSDGTADALALEWVKVRKGPQLTNCAGMKSDSSCSAF